MCELIPKNEQNVKIAVDLFPRTNKSAKNINTGWSTANSGRNMSAGMRFVDRMLGQKPNAWLSEKTKSNILSNDEQLSKRLWGVSEEMTKVSYDSFF